MFLKIDLLLYQTEIISLSLYVIALAQGRNKLYISCSIHLEILLGSLSMTLVFLVKLRKLLIPGYLPYSKGDYSIACETFTKAKQVQFNGVLLTTCSQTQKISLNDHDCNGERNLFKFKYLIILSP